ncbi:hypothetical protein Cch01nite_08700 [Cellulomonas chitinilytica]|uniref:Protein-glutamine gamma-glutamyltransferase-like C-terminal domain-containing protein n=1 Tax=Cellulomonas chitinilytica TaxID=398759 RepID=A0A919P1W3_9CELL|nr:DUF4129 domain-containing protein [Cellulomonas chitinilytica]GIG20146.1 hypothetical protein Cch01nite_08700 [Cellulomonas chitinilytica]
MTHAVWAAHLGARTSGLRLEVPVEPDAATARRWAEQELADPVYHQSRSLLDRLLDWVLDLLDGIPAPVVSPGVSLAVVIGVVVLVAAVVLWAAGPIRRSRAAAGRDGRSVLGDDDQRTADQLRSAADAAASTGDWSLAVVERFRAVVRGLEERTVLDARLGRTAHEATVDASVRLPSLGAALGVGGRLFDDVAYGHVTATSDDDRALRDLDRRVRETRPVAPGDRSEQAVAAPR